MTFRTKNRGSALVLVVGLLTILAMFGSAFLIVARMDARQSSALVDRGQPDSVAKGIADQLAMILARDLRIDGDKGPYSDPLMSGTSGWAHYVDYPSEEVDPHLATYLSSGGVWDHPTNIEGRTTDVNNVPASHARMVDTDEDGTDDPDSTNDAYLFDTEVTNSRGERYRVAVRLIDLGGLLCVNTGADGRKEALLTPVAPVNVDLQGILQGLYNNLHAERCDTGSQALPAFHSNVAVRLPSPEGEYKPFAIGDEMFLRYYAETGATTKAGRLHELLSTFGNDTVKLLTTFNCSRALMREPTLGEVIVPNADSDADRQATYNQMAKFFSLFVTTGGSTGGGGGEPFDGKYDFGTSTSPVETGYTRVTESTAYNSTAGYGWTAGTGRDSRDRTSGTALERDFVFDDDSTFSVDVSDGSYTVTVSVGDKNWGHDNQGIYLEGTLAATITTAAGEIKTQTLSTNVSDGQLNVRIKDLGGSDPSVSLCGLTVSGGGGGGGEIYEDAKRVAAMWTANLWAYTRSQVAGEAPYAFKPTGEPFTAFAMTPKMKVVFTEAFAAHKANNHATGDNHEWGYAVEIRNLSGGIIDCAKYKLNGTQLSSIGGVPGTLGDDGRLVLYDFGKGADSTTTAQVFFDSPANWGDYHQSGVVDFSGGGTVTLRLTRTETVDSTTVDVPVDQVSNDDLGYSCASKAAPAADQTKDIRRDDDPSDGRFLLAVYKAFAGHALGLSNGVNADFDAAKAKYPVFVNPKTPASAGSAAPLQSVGELGQVFACGPLIDKDPPTGALDEKWVPFTTRIVDTTFKDAFPEDALHRARLDLHPPKLVKAGGYPDNVWEYPNVPAAAMLGEFFRLIETDSTRSDDSRCIYGRVNVNTAPASVLKHLFTTEAKYGLTAGEVLSGIDPQTAANYIVAYREKALLAGTRNYATRETAAGITDLRKVGTSGDIKGFLSLAEVAVPLIDYATDSLLEITGAYSATDGNDPRNKPEFAAKRDALFNAISDLITVNSDVYAANILIELYTNENPKPQWRYLTVIDRSGCRRESDRPRILLFTEIK